MAVFVLILVLAITLIFALPRFKKIQGLTGNLNRVTREQLTGIWVVRAYNAEDYQEQKFAPANDEVTVTNMTANRVMALMSPTMILLSSGLTPAVYWIGAYLIEAADMGSRLAIFSDMAVFSNYAMQVIMAFMLLNMIFILLPRAWVSANRICEVLDTQVNITDGPGAKPVETGTVASNVAYGENGRGGIAADDIQEAVSIAQAAEFLEKMDGTYGAAITDTHATGDTLSRVTNDVDTVGQSMNQCFSTLIFSVALLLGAAFMMLITNWLMVLCGIAAALLGFWIVTRIIAKSQTYFAQQQAELGGLNGQVEESCAGLQFIKAYNGEAGAWKEFHQRNERIYNCAWKSQFLSGMMMPLMNFIRNLAYVVVCIVGAVLAMQGHITFGVIVSFMLYIRNFTYPLQNISQAIQSVQSMAAACERVFEFLDAEEMEDESGKTAQLREIRGDVTFDHANFEYKWNQPIIHDFSAQVKAGQKIAIEGPTGAGKTTIVNLLMRFYEASGGSISIDGVPIWDLKRENVHDLFGMVLQDTWMFEGTVRENLVDNKANVPNERLDEVCRAIGLMDLIDQLPNRYDTVLGDNTTLSAGQKQLFTVARAMLEDVPLLILDGATSPVDTRTELQVQKAMDLLTQGRTSFVIAHRISTIKNSDCILVMKDGDIIESGTHDELLAKGGFYADLYNSQFEQAA